jgi:hypothetical protein
MYQVSSPQAPIHTSSKERRLRMPATAATTSTDNARRAKLLETIGERAREIQESAEKSQNALAEMAQAIIDSRNEPGSKILDYAERALRVIPPFNRCQIFLHQAAADANVGNWEGASTEIKAYLECLSPRAKLPPNES